MRPRKMSDEVLFDRALDAFAELGYDGASLRAICRELDVSHNLINKRFGTKEALWYAAIDYGFRQVVAELRAGYQEGGDDPREQLRSSMVRFVTFTAKRPALIRILHQESARPGPRYQYLFDRYVAPINRVGLLALEQLQREGKVRSGPISTAYFFLTTYGLGVMASYPDAAAALGDDTADPGEVNTLGIDMVLDSLRPVDTAADVAQG